MKIPEVQRIGEMVRREVGGGDSTQISKVMYMLNDDITLIKQFIREAPTFKMYMPFSPLEDSLILRFFDPNE